MNSTNLLSGLIGAVLGGVLAIVASFMTMRQQRTLALSAAEEDRRQLRLAASRNACIEILACMVTIKAGLNGLATEKEDSPEAVAAYNAADRITIVHNALVEDTELRSRIDTMVNVVLWEWRNSWNASAARKAENKKLVMQYMGHVSDSIRTYLDNRPLPPEQQSPSLQTTE